MLKCPTCPKCSSYYSTKEGHKFSRNPILLLCGHTFCSSCLYREMQTSTVSCPTCQRITPVEGDGGTKSLWPDVYTTGLIICNQKILLDQELSKISPAGMSVAPARRKEDSCRREKLCRECCKRQAVCKCDRCDFIMCKLCFSQIHSISNTLKQHQAIPLTAEERLKNGNFIHLETASRCSTHEGKLIEYFCEDDNTPVCSRCVITGEHRNHSILSMEEKNKAVIADMEPAIQTASSVVKKMKKTEKSLVSLLPDMRTETADVLNEISAYFTELHSILQAREKQLTIEVYQAFKAGLEPLQSLKQQMQDDIKQLELAIKAGHRFLGSTDEIVLNAKEILENLQQAKEVPCIVEPKPAVTDKIRFQKDDNLVKLIWKLGEVTGSVPVKADWFTLSQKPECLITDDGDSSGSRTSADSISVVSSSRLSEDVVIESESVVSSRGSNRSLTPDLDTVPTREKVKGTSTEVFVTQIRNPCRFGVQKFSDTYKLDQLSRNINTYANSHSSMIPQKLERGDLILAKFNDKRWYRARVRDVIPGKTEESTIVEVIYVDFGNSEKITKDRTRAIVPKFARIPEFLIECCLHDIRPPNDTGTWPQEAIEAFAKMTNAKKMNLIVVREVNNILHVDLCKPPNDDIKDDRPVSVRDSLVFLELAQFISPDTGNVVGQSSVRRAFVNPEPKMSGMAFEGLCTSASNPHVFYVQEMTEDSRYFASVMQDMLKCYNQEVNDLWAIDCPQVGMPCVCKYSMDGLWYRATVTGLPGDKHVDIHYVDFGNNERVPYWSLRKILDRFMTVPIQGIKCILADVEPTESTWTSDDESWFSKRMTMKLFTVYVTEVTAEGIHVVLQGQQDRNTVNSEIVQIGRALSTGKGSSVFTQLTEEDSSEDSTLLKRPSTSGQSSDSYTTPNSSPLKSDKSPRQQDVNKASPRKLDIGFSRKPQKEERQSPRRETLRRSTNKEKLIAKEVNTSPQKEKTDSPEKTKLKRDQGKTALTLDVDAAQRSVPSTAASEPESPSIELEVVMCNFTSPTDFYLQVATAGRDGLDRLMEDLGNQYRTSEDQWITWEPNSFCAARHPVDKRWYRAKILQVIHKSIVEVFMVDFGFTEQISISEIRPLLKMFLGEMCYAFHCHLDNIVSAGDMKKWSKTACEFMESEVKDKRMYIQKKGDAVNDSCPVDLLMEEEIAETALEPSRKHYYSLTDKLIDQGLAIPIKRRKRKVVTDEEKIKQRKVFPVFQWRPPVLPIDSSFLGMPVYVDYDGVIWIQEVKENDTTLNKMVARIQAKFTDSEPHRLSDIKWKEGQACVALFHLEKVWHRAKVLQVEMHRIQVEFVDFGNVEWVTHDHMRADVMEFVEIPVQCFSCVLYKVRPISETGKWTVGALDKLHHKIVNKPCVIDIMECEDDQPLEVTMTLPDQRDVSDWLYRDGLCCREDDISIIIDRSKQISQVLSRKNLAYPTVTLPPLDEPVNVCITHVETPDVVYFQFTTIDECIDERTREINEQLARLSGIAQELMMVAPTCMPLPKPRSGLPCLGQFTVDSCWYRGLVIEADNNSRRATVLYVDYGNHEELTYDRIRALPVQYLDLPAQGVRMKLNGIRMAGGQKYWTRAVLQAMMDTVGGQGVKIACLKKYSPVTGDLFSLEEPSCLAYQTLLDQGIIGYNNEAEDDQEDTEYEDQALGFNEAVVGGIPDDVIVESQEEVYQDLNTSSSTTKGDDSVDEPSGRTRKKTWTDDEEDPLD